MTVIWGACASWSIVSTTHSVHFLARLYRLDFIRSSVSSNSAANSIAADGDAVGWLNPLYFRHILLEVLHPRMVKHFNVLESGIGCMEGVWADIAQTLMGAVGDLAKIMENCFHLRFGVRAADISKFAAEVREGMGRLGVNRDRESSVAGLGRRRGFSSGT